MMVDARKYKEAIPELEQAISLDPEEEMLYISAGTAYLKVGDSTKGMQAFEKAIKLKPGPLVWNDVAYYMSLSKIQLERAQQYAESAVTTTAAELRNVELNEIGLEDLGLVSSLAAYWDTLGWVYYQKGDVTSAERYIRAAWNLGQHSEVGAHLAEIAEKAGKKDDALQLYSLASVATRPAPEATEGLARLGKPKTAESFQNATQSLNAMRTIKFASGQKNIKASEAQFYVVLVPGPSGNAQVSEVKFIKGDDKLVPISAGLKSANFNFAFPDNTTTKIFRRGTLFCDAATGQCSFILITPDGISSVE
jgi:tetratricopeptide (TPR) repeat protein